LLSQRQAVSLRTVTRIAPSADASRSAFFTVERQTPASAAMWLIVSVQRLCLRISTAMTASAAASPKVNLAASCGGIAPEAAQERRLAIEAAVLGREPTCRCAGLCGGGSAFLAAIKSARL
jgi:hypothetical protein